MIRRYDGRLLILDTQGPPARCLAIGITRYFTVFFLGSGWERVTEKNPGPLKRRLTLVIDVAGHSAVVPLVP